MTNWEDRLDIESCHIYYSILLDLRYRRPPPQPSSHCVPRERRELWIRVLSNLLAPLCPAVLRGEGPGEREQVTNWEDRLDIESYHGLLLFYFITIQ